MVEVKCPLCGSERITKWRRGNFDYSMAEADDFKITDSDYGLFPDFLKCETCGLRFAEKMPTPSQLVKLYSQVEDPEYENEAEGRGENFKRIIGFLKKIKPGGRLLDVGAATGIFMEIARKEGWDVYGIEASLWAANRAKEKGLNVWQGDFLQFSSREKFDIITMLDIIEHMAKPGLALEKARELLKPGGILVITTPDVESFAARIFGRKWWHFRPAHVNFFSKRTLLWATHNYGFRILKLRTYVWNFSIHYLITRFSWGRKYFNWEWLKKIKLKLFLFDSMEAYLEKLPESP